MIRATVDTNTLASGAIARSGTIAELFDGWRKEQYELVISDHILLELARTLHKPYFLARLDATGRREFFMLLLESASLVQVTEPVPTILKDKADNLVLATALIAQTPYIISGDRELQRLDTFRGVRIVSAREFLDLLLTTQR